MIEYYLPAILLIGLFTSYEDIKKGIIRNKYVLAGFGLSVIIHILLLIFKIIDLNYLGLLGLSVLFAFVIGFFMYLMDWWNAADAKLYTAFASLTPIITYEFGIITLPFVDLLINSLLIAFLLVLVQIIIQVPIKQKIKIIKQSFNPKEIGWSLITIFSLSWIAKLLVLPYINGADVLVTLLVIIGIRRLIVYLAKDYVKHIILALTLIRVIFDRSILSVNFIIFFSTITLLYILIINIITRFSFIFEEKRKLYNLKKQIKSNIPFAPFLFIGILLTILIKGNIIIYLKHLLG